MIHTILLDGKEIQYNLERKKVKNINLRIKPDNSVWISANNSVSHEKIESFLKDKSEFMEDKADEQQKDNYRSHYWNNRSNTLERCFYKCLK